MALTEPLILDSPQPDTGQIRHRVVCLHNGTAAGDWYSRQVAAYDAQTWENFDGAFLGATALTRPEYLMFAVLLGLVVLIKMARDHGIAFGAICCALFVFDLVLLIFGAANVGLAYGASTRSTLIPSIAILVIALGLYVFRVVVQEKKPLQLRLPAATVPEEEAAIGAPTSTV